MVLQAKTAVTTSTSRDEELVEPNQKTIPNRKPTRYDRLSTYQKYSYHQLRQLNGKTRKRNSVLKSADFDDCAPRSWLTGNRDGQKLADQWDSELNQTRNATKHEDATTTAERKPSLLRAIRRTHGASYLVILACIFASDLVCEPAFFYLGIRLIEIIGEFVPAHEEEVAVNRQSIIRSNNSMDLTGQPNNTDSRDTTGQLYGHALLFLVAIVAYQLLAHPYAWLNHKMGLKLRVALSEMVYRKSLQIDGLSCSQSHEQALNLIARDLESLEGRFLELAWILAGPLQCLVFTAIVSQRLDFWTALVVWILNAATCIQRSIINFKLRKYQRLASAVADKRNDLVGEVLEGIRLVRMYAWTQPMETKIENNRCQELDYRKRHLAARGIDVALFFITTSAAALLALMFGYYARGLPITQSMVSQIFLVSATYRRALSRNLAQGMQAWAQVLVVVERCQDYLSAPDRPKSVLVLERQQEKSEIQTNGATQMNLKDPLGDDEHQEPTQRPLVCQLKDVSIAWPYKTSRTSVREGGQRQEEVQAKDLGAERGFCLRQVDLRAREGELILVAGQVGSGKSTLLQVVLGELAPTKGSVQLREGTKVAYASQKAWIFSGTVRENILLGQGFSLDRYYEVLRVCALLPDLEAMPDFDRTRIGERGVTLSGGQKARINLARALYQQAKLYLLDDPLSAVDSHVSSYIFSEALRGDHLRGKTIILVTHQVQYLNQADKILYLGSNDNERANFFGTFEELERFNLLADLLASCSQEKLRAENQRDGRLHSEWVSRALDRDWIIGRILSNRLDKSREFAAIGFASSQNNGIGVEQDEMYEVLESRQKNEGHVKTSKVSRATEFYLNNAGGFLKVFWLVSTSIATRCIFLGLNLFLNFWAGYQVWFKLNKDDSRPVLAGNKLTLAGAGGNSETSNLKLSWLARWIIELPLEGALAASGLIWLAIVVVSSIRTIQFYTTATRAGRRIHRRLINSLLWTKLSFFDRTPQGHLINRLSADISYMDTSLCYQMDQITITGLSLAFVFVGTVLASPKLALVVCLLAAITYSLFKYLADFMEIIKYLDGFRRSNVYSHVGATLDGLPTIRSSQQRESFIRTFNQLLDKHSSVRFLIISVRRLINGSIDFILIAFYIFLVVFMVYDTLNGNGAYAFVSLNLVVQMARIAQNTISVFIEFYLSVQSMDRVREYTTELEHEKWQLLGPYLESSEDLKRLTEQFTDKTRNLSKEARNGEESIVGLEEPQFTHGAIRFSGVSLKFLHTNKLVLDNVSFRIEPGSKVGIIGRTGAGKSSIITVLFHLYHYEGFVYIDDQDTKQLQLEHLRKSISIIPQDPWLFTGSIRHNLDPFEEHSDEKLWRSLEVVQLKQLVQASSCGLEMLVTKSGANFSIGQRQLICLARAILKKNKILVMDEATSNIDQETDSLIQQAIKNEFMECTVLTIAHRLSTVIELDKLMIMQDGQLVEFGTPAELLERGSDGLLCGMIESTGEQQGALLRSKIAQTRSNCSVVIDPPV